MGANERNAEVLAKMRLLAQKDGEVVEIDALIVLTVRETTRCMRLPRWC